MTQNITAVDEYRNTQTNNPQTTTNTNSVPTEIVSLPSKGIPYPAGHPLSSGKIEMKYMTAREEDILTNQSYIKSGIVFDKLFQSLIVTPVNYDDILIGDKNAIMIAARVLGYGSKYPIKVVTPSGETKTVEIDLTTLENKTVDWSLFKQGSAEFSFVLPTSKHNVVVKLLTEKDLKLIDRELDGLAKIHRDAQLTTRLKHTIVEVDGNRDNAYIRKFVDDELLAIDSRALRQFIQSITPDIELITTVVDEATLEPFRTPFTIGLDFFWPDAKL